ncbi:hypothetical protein SS50377_20046 [Spironucleus salmonicida]|uniref:Uncharacterized protein n=1 Tax=Spironucleus salmonicida TaxID=348837 RepID=V6LXV5_9EUKA|nr:hypothetical protein SS50377_20046 [Spironucleus salmonicida]|eukprot:EST49385.1 Hypothetical protein SS50377_10310 [Spironucleus salmonicida]
MRNWRQRTQFSTPVDCDVARELGTINTFHRRQQFKNMISSRQQEIDIEYLNDYNHHIDQYHVTVLQRYNEKLMMQIKDAYTQNQALFLTEIDYNPCHTIPQQIQKQPDSDFFAKIPETLGRIYFSAKKQRVSQKTIRKIIPIRYCKLEPTVLFRK